MTQAPGIVLAEKRGQAFFREDAGKGAFIPVENCNHYHVLPANQSTPYTD